MIKPLRKIHLQIWIILAVLLPVGIISTWFVIPHPVKDRLLQPIPTQALPLLLKSYGQRIPCISIRTNADSTVFQLEYINATELVFPSVLIYQVSDSNKTIEDGNILGRIDMRGAYHFPLKKHPGSKNFYFVMYDIIHHKIIQRINL